LIHDSSINLKDKNKIEKLSIINLSDIDYIQTLIFKKYHFENFSSNLNNEEIINLFYILFFCKNQLTLIIK
jgi:hypothetical protein